MDYCIHLTIPHSSRHSLLLCAVAARLHDCGHIHDTQGKRAYIFLLWCVRAARTQHTRKAHRPHDIARIAATAHHRLRLSNAHLRSRRRGIANWGKGGAAYVARRCEHIFRRSRICVAYRPCLRYRKSMLSDSLLVQ